MFFDEQVDRLASPEALPDYIVDRSIMPDGRHEFVVYQYRPWPLNLGDNYKKISETEPMRNGATWLGFICTGKNVWSDLFD